MDYIETLTACPCNNCLNSHICKYRDTLDVYFVNVRARIDDITKQFNSTKNFKQIGGILDLYLHSAIIELSKGVRCKYFLDINKKGDLNG